MQGSIAAENVVQIVDFGDNLSAAFVTSRPDGTTEIARTGGGEIITVISGENPEGGYEYIPIENLQTAVAAQNAVAVASSGSTPAAASDPVARALASAEVNKNETIFEDQSTSGQQPQTAVHYEVSTLIIYIERL